MDYEAQLAVIGSLLMDISQIEKVYTVLTPDKFSDEYLGRIYYEIKKSYDEGKSADLNILTFKLGDIVGINALLNKCLESVVTSTKIDEYADIINRSYITRMSEEIMNAQLKPSTIYEQLEEISEKIQELKSGKEEETVTGSELIQKHKEGRFTEARDQGIQTGFPSVDETLMGMDKKDVVIIGARPAVGKTAFAMNMARNIAKSGKKVEFFSLEMDDGQIYDRLISLESDIELKRIRRAIRFNENEEEKFRKGNERVREYGDNLLITCDVDTIPEMQMNLKKHKADIAIIDYLQLVSPGSRYKGVRYAEVGEISRGLKRMARKLKIPVVALCQLNRSLDETKEPSMNELRESGDIEQDASQIILLWNKTEDKKTKGIKIAKNRNGELGTIVLEYDGSRTKFIDKGDFNDADETPFE